MWNVVYAHLSTHVRFKWKKNVLSRVRIKPTSPSLLVGHNDQCTTAATSLFRGTAYVILLTLKSSQVTSVVALSFWWSDYHALLQSIPSITSDYHTLLVWLSYPTSDRNTAFWIKTRINKFVFYLRRVSKVERKLYLHMIQLALFYDCLGSVCFHTNWEHFDGRIICYDQTKQD